MSRNFSTGRSLGTDAAPAARPRAPIPCSTENLQCTGLTKTYYQHQRPVRQVEDVLEPLRGAEHSRAFELAVQPSTGSADPQ